MSAWIRRVPAEVAADEMAVQRDGRVAEDAVEFERDPPTLVAGREREDAPVPSDAGRGIVAPQRMIAKVVELLRLDVRQFDRPVVRQVHGAPTAVVEVAARRPEELARLAEFAVLVAAVPEAEVLGQVVGVAEMKAPVEIEEESLARDCGRGRRAQGGEPRGHGGGGAGLQELAAGPEGHGSLGVRSSTHVDKTTS